MNSANIINTILVIYFSLSAITGFKRGLLSRGQWMLGIVFGFLAVPIISPFIEALLKETQFIHMLKMTDASVITSLSVYLLRVLIFSLSLVIMKGVVYHFTDFELSERVKIIDRTAGALFSVLEACFFIWIFDWLTLNSSVSRFYSVQEIFLSSEIYTIVTNNNIIRYFIPELL